MAKIRILHPSKINGTLRQVGEEPTDASETRALGLVAMGRAELIEGGAETADRQIGAGETSTPVAADPARPEGEGDGDA